MGRGSSLGKKTFKDWIGVSLEFGVYMARFIAIQCHVYPILCVEYSEGGTLVLVTSIVVMKDMYTACFPFRTLFIFVFY